MKNISAIVIAKNEEKMIGDCLTSISFCDEIILIDNGSTDKTLEIGKSMGAQIFEKKSSDFSELRNFGLSKASGNWILYVDADERIDLQLRENIESVIKNNENKIAGYKLKRKNFYFGSSMKNEWPCIEKIKRLFKKDSLKTWKGELHESPIINGEIKELDGFLLHFTHRDLSSMLKKTIEWSKIEAELRFKSKHPQMAWWRFPRVMLNSFFNSFFQQGGWKIGTVGLIESIYQSFSMFITYLRLWELQQNEK